VNTPRLRQRSNANAGLDTSDHARSRIRQLRDAAVASAVTARAGKSAAPVCHANGSAVVFALEVVRWDLQADLTVGPVA